MKIERAAVIGAGVMGAGIAAHLANAGLQVELLDVVPDGASDRDALAAGAIKAMVKADPPPFMTAKAAKRVRAGNLEDHLDRLGKADWIIEAVVEDLAIKRTLFTKIASARKPGAVVSSNTSTLPLANLVDGLPADFARDFLITHFFNPPRFMRLLEVVGGPQTRPEILSGIVEFADIRLGKGVVMCKDTPSFIANRIGTYWLRAAIVDAIAQGLAVVEADAVMSRPLGIPKTGVFGLLDLVGIDLMPKIDASMAATLPADDPYNAIRTEIPLIDRMIADGYTGRKGKGGFYRLDKSGGGRIKQAVSLVDGSYAPAGRPALASLQAAKDAGRKGAFRALVEHADRGGVYAWSVMSKTLAYAASLVPEIAEDILAVDRAMELGYNWKAGPFRLIDALGADYLAERLKADGHDVPPLLATAVAAGGFYQEADGRPRYLGVDGAYHEVPKLAGILSLADIKRASEPVIRNGSASLWDIGDGVACLEFHTKLNTIDPDGLDLLEKSIKRVAKDFKALVIYNEGSQFSAGANLGLALFAANTAMWPMIEDMVARGQKALTTMAAAKFPVVGAPSGLALGGGCEILLHCDAVQAHAESYIGLVEAGVGVVPGWGGCAALLSRLANAPGRPGGPIPPVAAAFETIGMAKVARSAFEAMELSFLRASDRITFNRDRLLADAKARALELVTGYEPAEPQPLRLPGPAGKAALRLALNELRAKGAATAHDCVVAEALADVLSGGPDADPTEPVETEEIRTLERKAFMDLVRTDPTLARIEHTLMTGKPLRN